MAGNSAIRCFLKPPSPREVARRSRDGGSPPEVCGGDSLREGALRDEKLTTRCPKRSHRRIRPRTCLSMPVVRSLLHYSARARFGIRFHGLHPAPPAVIWPQLPLEKDRHFFEASGDCRQWTGLRPALFSAPEKIPLSFWNLYIPVLILRHYMCYDWNEYIPNREGNYGQARKKDFQH